MSRALGQIVMREPTSTARSSGMQKWSEASLAERASGMKILSCHSGSPDWDEGCSARRDRKNETFSGRSPPTAAPSAGSGSP